MHRGSKTCCLATSFGAEFDKAQKQSKGKREGREVGSEVREGRREGKRFNQNVSEIFIP